MHVEDFIPTPRPLPYRARLNGVMEPWKVTYGVLSVVVVATMVGGIAALEGPALAMFYLFSLGWLPLVPVVAAMVVAAFIRSDSYLEGEHAD
jgi:hypothetical protein